MVARQLGKLERADIRTVWKSEASNFAPLLASFEGFEMLSAAIELELEAQEIEKSVGRFSLADFGPRRSHRE
jgi:F420-dependent methylenetetrahydromethanopterin dehydrogenase